MGYKNRRHLVKKHEILAYFKHTLTYSKPGQAVYLIFSRVVFRALSNI